jgi:hypothetical protein
MKNSRSDDKEISIETIKQAFREVMREHLSDLILLGQAKSPIICPKCDGEGTRGKLPKYLFPTAMNCPVCGGMGRLQ